MSTKQSYINDIRNSISDPESRLTDTIIQTQLDAAVREFSRKRPRQRLAEITGDTTKEYSTPTGWVVDFSAIGKLEYPIDQFPPTFLDERDDYELRRTADDTEKIAFVEALGVTEKFRIAYTTMHTVDDTTDSVPSTYYNLVVKMGTIGCLRWLATFYAQTSDPTILADVVNYRSKSGEFTSLADARQKEVDKELSDAAIAYVEWDLLMAWRQDRLFHPKRWM